MARITSYAAADLGATSGRVILGRLVEGRFELTEAARFANTPITVDGHLHWDAVALFAEIRHGFQVALEATGGALSSVGIDTWGVDHGRVDAAGELLEPPFNYRDDRTAGVPERVFAAVPGETLYSRTGLQVQQFNTLFQFAAAAGDPGWARVADVLLMPDLFGFWLTGRRVAEVTNASTTGLLDATGRVWSHQTCAELATAFGLPLPAVLPKLVEPGTILGRTRPGVLSAEVPVVAVGSHDTASAVAAIPTRRRDFAYISSGTWSLVGLELDTPVLTEASRAANFTNELGVDGTVRYLKNVMGLWVLTECQRAWAADGLDADLAGLLDAAAREPALTCVLDMNDDRLLPPGGMPARLLAFAAETGQRLEATPAAITRCIMDSLAVAYRDAIRQACALSGREVSVVHVVGGGSQNALLCQLTAELTGLPVVAGPAEATALGNLLVQARATRALSGDLMALRQVALASSDLVTYTPGELPLPAGHGPAGR